MIGVEMNCWTKLLVVGGLILTSVSLLWPVVLSTLMYQELKLSPGTKSFQHWEKTPVPMYIDIYFHNWTNPKKVNTERPMFNQMGPYRFYEKRTKVNLTWNDNGTVSYRQTRHWFFDPEHSNGTLEDKVTTVNMVPVVTAHIARFRNSRDLISLSWTFTALNLELEVVKTVSELLFDGYQDRLLSILQFFPVLTKIRVSDRFGWFYKRNGSEVLDGLFNMDTGTKDLSQVGKIRSWNYKNKTNYFPGQCGDVAGTSGEVFPPWLTPKDRIGLFSGDLCRTINLDYEKDTSVNGIHGLKFTGGTDLVDSGLKDPGTACYRNGEQTPLGLLNITECRHGAPIFVSYPHFYLADKEVQTQVGGMNPNKDKHSFDLSVEPTFGVPLDVKGRFQINIMVQPEKNILLLRNLPRRYYIPILWFDQRASLTEPLANEVGFMVTLYHVCNTIAMVLLVVGVLSAAIGITLACKELNKALPNKLPPYRTYSMEAKRRQALITNNLKINEQIVETSQKMVP
uniref:Putative plasma membrane glycoprotein cd36 n=1 Tax=Panstrongylus lignarius TaxID=156445 RepID=A0A224XEZ7_9HEMI